jgi:hypothetical protein
VAHQIRKSFSDINDWAQYLNNNPQLIGGLICKDLMELGPRHGVPVLVSFGNFLRISVKIDLATLVTRYIDNLTSCFRDKIILEI